MARVLLFCAMLAWSCAGVAGQLHGQVNNSTGLPIANAMVSLQHTVLKKELTTYTDIAGQYQLPVEDTGLYNLRIRRIGYGTVTDAAISFLPTTTIKRSDVLKAVPKSLWVHDLPASDWYARLQFSSPALRAQFSIQCAMCHQQGSSTTRLARSEDDWITIFGLMAEFGAVVTQDLYDEAPKVLNAAYDYNNLDLASFPDMPAVLDTSAERVVISEWQVGHPTAFLHDLTLGDNNIVYSVDWIGDKLYALNPATNQIKEWRIPTGDLEPGGILGILAERGRRYLHQTPTVAPHSLQKAPDGSIWITLSIGKGLARFDPVSETFQTFDQPDDAMYPHTLRFDADGNIWYTVSMTNHLAKYNVAENQFTVYDLPTRNFTQWLLAKGMGVMVWLSNALNLKGQAVVSDAEMNPVPYGIDVAPNGNIWFSQFNNRRIGYLNPANDEITMLDTEFYGPRRLRSDSKGILWVPSYSDGKFYRYQPSKGQFTEYTLPTGKGDLAYALAIDPRDDSVWLCGTNSDSIIHFNPEDESFKVYQLPTKVSFTREIEVDHQGNVWTSISNMPFYQIEGGQGKIVRLSFPKTGS